MLHQRAARTFLFHRNSILQKVSANSFSQQNYGQHNKHVCGPHCAHNKHFSWQQTPIAASKNLQQVLLNRMQQFDNQAHLYSTKAKGETEPESEPGTFVSNYYQVKSETEITDFLTRQGLTDHRIAGEEIVVKECPFCHDTKGVQTNMWKLYINRIKGAYLCHRCGSKGNWFDLKYKLEFGKHAPLYNPVSNAEQRGMRRLVPSPEEIESFQEAFNSDRYHDVAKFLEKRGISKEVAKKYQVGSGFFNFFDERSSQSRAQLCVTFPMFRPRNFQQLLDANKAAKKGGKKTHQPIVYEIARHKIRSIHDKRFMKLDPIGGQWGLFGFNTVPDDASEIIITEGEFDAMAVHQITGKPAVSLPNGCRSLPVDLLPMLERFDKIYLWMDDDAPGQQGAEQFSQKLGIGRSFIVHSSLVFDSEALSDEINLHKEKRPPKDANDAMLAGIDLNDLLKRAQPIRHHRITTYTQLKGDVYREFFDKSKEVNGVQSMFFPKWNTLLKGLRRGELSIYTGPTGIGKTTILSMLSLDFALQDVPTLWGSFEIKNTRLIKKMLCQLAGKDLGKCTRDEFEQVSERFHRLPTYFMNFHGSTNVDQVLDAMDYAVYVHDVQHVIIDNLQFMTSGQGTGYEKFDIQDKALEKFRSFATNKNIHISMVVHPRKQEDNALLGLASVFGTAKATQESDNVVIIQRGKFYRYLSVKKNRFDGDLGDIPYRFDKSSNRIYELTHDQVEQAEQGVLDLQY